MHKTAKSVALLLVLAFTLSLVGCGGAPAKPAAPQKPKELTMYIGVVEQQALVIAKEFEKESGIKVNFVRMSGGETLGRIRAEKQSPKASVWYGGQLIHLSPPKRKACWNLTSRKTPPASKTTSKTRTVTGPASIRAISASSSTTASLRNANSPCPSPGAIC